MKFYRGNKGRLQSLLALLVCFGMLAPVCLQVTAAPISQPVYQDPTTQSAIKITSASATLTSEGVRLEWRSRLDPDNLGFNILRSAGNAKVRVNREIIPGAVFLANARTQDVDFRNYSWIDRAGQSGANYSIEWVSITGATQFVAQAVVVTPKNAAANELTTERQVTAESDVSTPFEKSFPAVAASMSPAPAGTLENQWVIAGRPGLKISIKKDGWYRVTKSEMAGAGFDPIVDIRNLRLFSDGQELAINTSQAIGTFGDSDFIEFYGRGLDIPTADTRIYYLIADSVPGKRVGGAIHLDSTPVGPAPMVSAPALPVFTKPTWFGFVWTFLNPGSTRLLTETNSDTIAPKIISSGPKLRTREESSADVPSRTESVPPTEPLLKPLQLKPNAEPPLPPNKPPVDPKAQSGATVETITNDTKSPARRKLKGKKSKRRKQSTRSYNHAEITNALAPSNFDVTVQLRERLFYYPNPLNGDSENFFGRVISSADVNETLNTPNPDFAAAGPAKLEIAVQGVSNVPHQVNVFLNSTPIGSFAYANQDHVTQTFDVPLSMLQNGANTLTFKPVPGGFVSFVDYAHISYPHAFRADSDSLKFNLRGTQSLTLDGFSTPNVLLIDYTDPFSVSLTEPAAQPSTAGYSITVPAGTPRKKDQRLLYAIVKGQFEQAAALSLNQPSNLNSGNLSPTVSNGADFLIVAHKNFIAALAPLVIARQNQGFKVAVVDVEDVYDEFSFGVHGPQGIKAFLAHASSHWATTPRYIIFAGDASFDPRDYSNVGNFDFVPTKLVDATFNETASDDWLADFDDDGVANIPVGRLPLRTPADANLVISKIVNFTPVSPEAALLIADDPGTPAIWDFETSSDDVQALVPPAVPVQRVNVRVDGAAQATSNIIDGFGQGRTVVNYSGHGNVDVWSGASIFTAANATALTNGSKLPFVIVMDCLNGYYQDPTFVSLAEAFLRAPGGGAVAVFASSGLTSTPGQRQMELELYRQLYGSQSIALGDAIKIAKNASSDIDVRRTWIFFGDPSLKIR